MDCAHKCCVHHLANSNEEVVLEGKVRFCSLPAARLLIVGSPAEFPMQMGHAGGLASLYSEDIVSPVLMEQPLFGSQIHGDCSECSVIAAYREICWGRRMRSLMAKLLLRTRGLLE